MEFVEHLIVLLHFFGFASLLGGALVQVRSANPVVNNAMRDGAWTQLVTGLVLVVLAELFDDDPVNHAKVGIKLLVLIGILALVLINRKKEHITRGTLFTVLGLTAANAAVAVLW
ncbi:MAG: hypothetical protein WAS07_15610 [Micropruina sp.]|nr:hypothetical protein [Micropruina sp.]